MGKNEYNKDPELEPFSEVMAILGEGPLEAISEKPSEQLWQKIASEALPGSEVSQLRSVNSPQQSVTDKQNAKLWGSKAAMFAIAAGFFLLVAIPLGLSFRSGQDDTLLAADLEVLGGFDGAGDASLEGRTLKIEVDELPTENDSFFELWLLDLEGEEVSDLVTLGRIDSSGTFSVPADTDLSKFDVVDISREIDDGNPEHGGDSVLRGQLG